MGAGLLLCGGMRVARMEDGRWTLAKSLVFHAVFRSVRNMQLWSVQKFTAEVRGWQFCAGLIYITVQAVKPSRYFSWLRRNWLSLTLLGASLLFLMFWQFHFAEVRSAQRFFFRGQHQ